LQIIPAGNVIMADRYSYLPYIGFFFMMAVLAKRIIDTQKKLPNVVYAVLFIYVSCCAYFAFVRTKVWHDSMALWSDTIKNNPDAALPYNNRSVLFINSQQFSLALADLNKAIEIRPEYVSARYNRGTVLMKLEKYHEAIQDFTFVSQHECRDIVSVYMNRGDAYMHLKNYMSAIDDFSSAIQKNPNIEKAYYNRGLALYTINKFNEAINDFSISVKINPRFIQAYYLRGLAFYKLQDFKQAYEDISYAAKMGYRVNPNLASEISSKVH
jgi:tetratricopeptide (TPR) repeat protein